MEQPQATLFIIAAPSGAGKTSLVDALIRQSENILVSISYTTRPKNPSEQNGKAYHFVDEQKFNEMLANGYFLEHARVFSYQYGTPKDWVEEQLLSGRDVILEIDWQGARQIRKLVANTISIFILPPSREVLLTRLHQRGREDEVTIQRRMAALTAEMTHYHEFDYLVVNDDFEHALSGLKAIVEAQRLTLRRQQHTCAQILNNLLNKV